jgi:nucleotide-binding universal stress UspA family protein
MSTTNNHFLVPTDFTPVADCALDHALSVAKTVNGHVTLLHVIAKEGDRKQAQLKINEIAQKATASSGVPVEAVIKEGNIFDDIGGVAETLGAKLIFMGTHGVKGMQHITGSHAVKVFTNSNVPFVVVQERKIRNGGYKNIVLPMDLSKESKHKLDLTIKMAEYFGSKVHIYSQLETDEFIKKAIDRNTSYARSELQKKNIDFDMQTATEKGHFVKQLLDFAKSSDADLIAVVNSQERGVHELLSGTAERETITNEAQIPVMVVNPVSVTNSRIAFFITGQ